MQVKKIYFLRTDLHIGNSDLTLYFSNFGCENLAQSSLSS